MRDWRQQQICQNLQHWKFHSVLYTYPHTGGTYPTDMLCVSIIYWPVAIHLQAAWVRDLFAENKQTLSSKSTNTIQKSICWKWRLHWRNQKKCWFGCCPPQLHQPSWSTWGIFIVLLWGTPPLQSQLVIFPSDKQEFLPISHVVNKKWPLKLCACLWVLREVDFPSHKLNTLWIQRTGVHPQHFPRCSNITCLMEFPSYNLTAETKSNEQVLQSCRWLTGSFGFVFFFMLGVLRLAFSILVFLSM